ncbi:hypothetical protein L2E82_45715 [Cichorium intybus]|uniref:Uncharacterized protein n=1 Tax=Cichorium intybus TaxID=13427 RepID=A0ACB8ZTB9_CICIN|nr:hypothetical protein L2E82_45715 [Cichorium intybus]
MKLLEISDYIETAQSIYDGPSTKSKRVCYRDDDNAIRDAAKEIHEEVNALDNVEDRGTVKTAWEHMAKDMYRQYIYNMSSITRNSTI